MSLKVAKTGETETSSRKQLTQSNNIRDVSDGSAIAMDIDKTPNDQMGVSHQLNLQQPELQNSKASISNDLNAAAQAMRGVEKTLTGKQQLLACH